MKIAIDARSLTKNPTGIASYLINALNQLIKQKPDWHFYLLAHKPLNTDIEKRLNKQNNLHILIDSSKILKVGSVWYLVRLNFLLKKISPDYFWSPATLIPPYKLIKNTKILVTVHDLVAKEYKSTMSKFNILMNKLLFDKSIKRADIIWSVSEYSQGKVIEYYPETKDKKLFVGSCVDKKTYKKLFINETEKNAILKQYNISGKFLLFVGTLEPRKNIAFLLSLMPELAKDYYLLIVGGKGWGNTCIKDIIEQKDFPREKVIFADFTNTQTLLKLYNLAEIYISASFNEGFGLPQLEAMSCGCPVITAHNSAMIEVVDKAGLTVKGYKEEDWFDAIKKVSANRDLYADSCYQRSKLYNWESIIAQLILKLEQ